MTLEDFERNLEVGRKRDRSRSRSQERHRHRHHHSSRHDEHRSSKHHHRSSRHKDGEESSKRSHKRRRHSDDEENEQQEEPVRGQEDGQTADDGLNDELEEAANKSSVNRDAWMRAPSALDVEYVRRKKEEPKQKLQRSTEADYQIKIHKNELNHHLKDLQKEESSSPDPVAQDKPREVNYTFGDEGASWRMTKLKAVYRQAKESGQPVEDIALERFADLQEFDDAREEELELDRRKMYGKDHIGKEKPSGDLYEERLAKASTRRQSPPLRQEYQHPEQQDRVVSLPEDHLELDQTALNKLKAQMMKAKLRRAPEAASLEEKYNKAVAASSRKSSNVVDLNPMENRMLAGGRKGEVNEIDNKRGRERGLVVENEDMTIEDMVRQERRTKGRGEGMAFAETIAKDAKFDNDLDYMDENASKLAKHVHKSAINLRNIAIEDYQKLNRILDKCPLCHHEDKGTLPVAPIVSLATRVYLTLPTDPEISKGGACIVPIQHHTNLLECDEDEWEEIRNFMKCLIRMYHDQGKGVIFYENAAAPQRKKHAAMEVVPLPRGLSDDAPAFFREAIMASDEEWSQHKKLIDTLSKARNGLGKLAFRRTLVKEMPYFHIWFEIDGGFGHIVENADQWPKGDLFARETLGGMLDVEPDIIKRQGRWNRNDRRLEGFKTRWSKFDWTGVLTDG